MIARESYRDAVHRICRAHWSGERPMMYGPVSMGPIQDSRGEACEWCRAESVSDEDILDLWTAAIRAGAQPDELLIYARALAGSLDDRAEMAFRMAAARRDRLEACRRRVWTGRRMVEYLDDDERSARVVACNNVAVRAHDNVHVVVHNDATVESAGCAGVVVTRAEEGS